MSVQCAYGARISGNAVDEEIGKAGLALERSDDADCVLLDGQPIDDCFLGPQES